MVSIVLTDIKDGFSTDCKNVFCSSEVLFDDDDVDGLAG
jgi:hypothetical protein